MYTTNIPGVVISREAIDLAYAVARAVDHMLTQTAINQAGTAETWGQVTEAGKRIVGPKEIEAAAQTVAVDLMALIKSARAELHAREEARRAA